MADGAGTITATDVDAGADVEEVLPGCLAEVAEIAAARRELDYR